MIPIYSDRDQVCNHCESDLYIGYEFIIHDNTYYCNTECLTDEILNNIHVQNAYLTDDKTYKDFD